jgi:5'(3')-deoxyribonucleotidase
MDTLLKKILYVDMDGVLCNYLKAFKLNKEDNPTQIYPQSEFGFFLGLEPISGSLEAINYLKDYFDVWILTRPSVHNLSCYTEKAQWVRNHLGFDMQIKTIICTNKSLLKGSFLIDDQTEHGQLEFEGKLIQFGTEKFNNWDKIIEYLMCNKDQFVKSEFESQCGC